MYSRATGHHWVWSWSSADTQEVCLPLIWAPSQEKLSSEESRQKKPSPHTSFASVSTLEPGTQRLLYPEEWGGLPCGSSQQYSVSAPPRPWARRVVPVQVRGVCSGMWAHAYLYMPAGVAAENGTLQEQLGTHPEAGCHSACLGYEWMQCHSKATPFLSFFILCRC